MNLRTKQNAATTDAMLIDTEELRLMIGLGRNNAMKFGEEAGAKVKYGKRVLWSREKIEAHIRKLTEV